MPVGSFRGRPPVAPVKKLCAKCGKRSGNEARRGNKLCANCIALSPETRNSPTVRHRRQSGPRG